MSVGATLSRAQGGVWNGGGWIRQISGPEFGISGPEISEVSASNQQNKGFYWKLQALKSTFQGLKIGHSIHHRSMPHLLPAETFMRKRTMRLRIPLSNVYEPRHHSSVTHAIAIINRQRLAITIFIPQACKQRSRMCASLHQHADAGSIFQALCFSCTIYIRPHDDHVHKSKPCQRRPGPKGGGKSQC